MRREFGGYLGIVEISKATLDLCPLPYDIECYAQESLILLTPKKRCFLSFDQSPME